MMAMAFPCRRGGSSRGGGGQWIKEISKATVAVRVASHDKNGKFRIGRVGSGHGFPRAKCLPGAHDNLYLNFFLTLTFVVSILIRLSSIFLEVSPAHNVALNAGILHIATKLADTPYIFHELYQGSGYNQVSFVLVLALLAWVFTRVYRALIRAANKHHSPQSHVPCTQQHSYKQGPNKRHKVYFRTINCCLGFVSSLFSPARCAQVSASCRPLLSHQRNFDQSTLKKQQYIDYRLSSLVGVSFETISSVLHLSQRSFAEGLWIYWEIGQSAGMASKHFKSNNRYKSTEHLQMQANDQELRHNTPFGAVPRTRSPFQETLNDEEGPKPIMPITESKRPPRSVRWAQDVLDSPLKRRGPLQQRTVKYEERRRVEAKIEKDLFNFRHGEEQQYSMFTDEEGFYEKEFDTELDDPSAIFRHDDLQVSSQPESEVLPRPAVPRGIKKRLSQFFSEENSSGTVAQAHPMPAVPHPLRKHISSFFSRHNITSDVKVPKRKTEPLKIGAPSDFRKVSDQGLEAAYAAAGFSAPEGNRSSLQVPSFHKLDAGHVGLRTSEDGSLPEFNLQSVTQGNPTIGPPATPDLPATSQLGDYKGKVLETSSLPNSRLHRSWDFSRDGDPGRISPGSLPKDLRRKINGRECYPPAANHEIVGTNVERIPFDGGWDFSAVDVTDSKDNSVVKGHTLANETRGHERYSGMRQTSAGSRMQSSAGQSPLKSPTNSSSSKKSKSQGSSFLRSFFQTTEPSLAALQHMSEKAFQEAKVDPKDPDAAAKMKVSTRKLPPEAPKPASKEPKKKKAASNEKGEADRSSLLKRFSSIEGLGSRASSKRSEKTFSTTFSRDSRSRDSRKSESANSTSGHSNTWSMGSIAEEISSRTTVPTPPAVMSGALEGALANLSRSGSSGNEAGRTSGAKRSGPRSDYQQAKVGGWASGNATSFTTSSMDDVPDLADLGYLLGSKSKTVPLTSCVQENDHVSEALPRSQEGQRTAPGMRTMPMVGQPGVDIFAKLPHQARPEVGLADLRHPRIDSDGSPRRASNTRNGSIPPGWDCGGEPLNSTRTSICPGRASIERNLQGEDEDPMDAKLATHRSGPPVPKKTPQPLIFPSGTPQGKSVPGLFVTAASPSSQTFTPSSPDSQTFVESAASIYKDISQQAQPTSPSVPTQKSLPEVPDETEIAREFSQVQEATLAKLLAQTTNREGRAWRNLKVNLEDENSTHGFDSIRHSLESRESRGQSATSSAANGWDGEVLETPSPTASQRGSAQGYEMYGSTIRMVDQPMKETSYDVDTALYEAEGAIAVLSIDSLENSFQSTEKLDVSTNSPSQRNGSYGMESLNSVSIRSRRNGEQSIDLLPAPAADSRRDSAQRMVSQGEDGGAQRNSSLASDILGVPGQSSHRNSSLSMRSQKDGAGGEPHQMGERRKSFAQLRREKRRTQLGIPLADTSNGVGASGVVI